MTQDEIIEIARQSGYLDLSLTERGMELKELEAFAKLVAAKEREACAKVCEDIEVEETHYCMNIYEEGTRYKFAVIEAIRARGNT